MLKKTLLALVILLILILGACSNSDEQVEQQVDDYPEESIKLIVPWYAGGDTDIIFRLVADGLSEEMGEKVVIENIAGGSGVVGAQEFLSAENDGYTLLAVHDSVTLSQLTGQADFGFDDFEPISLLTSDYDTVATHPDSKWEDMEDLIEDAKENPGEITFAASVGSTTQLLPAMIQSAADVEFNIVGYDGTAERMKAIAGGDVDLGGVSVAAGKEYLEDDRMKLLGFAGDERSEQLPDTETLGEQGVEAEVATNRGIVAPQDTPDEIIEILSEALDEVVNDEEFEEKVSELGTDTNYKNPE